jgi:hypothetical protein
MRRDLISSCELSFLFQLQFNIVYFTTHTNPSSIRLIPCEIFRIPSSAIPRYSISRDASRHLAKSRKIRCQYRCNFVSSNKELLDRISVAWNGKPVSYDPVAQRRRSYTLCESRKLLQSSFSELDERSNLVPYINGFVQGVVRAFQQDLQLVLCPELLCGTALSGWLPGV